ncbi:MAG: peptidase M22 [Oscillospiraceae bacterium]|jgi:N6-L-threonylcarbamoyladenine synthase|nr:peptidase M22 [Oscillospiraceae bacterium]
MSDFLGIDTSNYTCSLALYNKSEGTMAQNRKVLSVKEGFLGLKQSDAVFQHVKLIPEAANALMKDRQPYLKAVGVSVRPKDGEDSYMPCFIVGKSVAHALASVSRVPVYEFSHQAGHIAAAVFSSGNPELIKKEFIAFHVSGGTTETVFVQPDQEKVMRIKSIGQSLDLKAGQLVDRVGGLLGLKFPAGEALEKLAGQSSASFALSHTTKPVMRGADCSLSGFENKCEKLYKNKISKENIAKFCLEAVARTVFEMTAAAMELHPGLPVLYAGGVLSNSIIRAYLGENLERSAEIFFAEPEYSRDNAAGLAWLAALANAL